MTQLSDRAPIRDDVELAQAAAAGDGRAFDDLYRRHADAAWRVAYAVTGNRDDAADAVAEAFTRMLTALTAGRLGDLERVRAYLLATTRNAAIDVLRRSGRLQPLDDLPAERTSSLSSGPSDRLLEGVDAGLIASAFLGLPERWRSVLWLTEVEGMAPAEAAGLLGVSANNAAQLAVRARAGLRQRFLQAHIRDEAPEECAFARDRLGAYVGGALAPRDIAKVDQHLAGCPACRRELAELEDLGTTLRRVAIPLPAALGALAWEHWKKVSAAESARRGAVAVGTHRALAGASATLLGLGIIALGILGHPGDGLAGGVGRQATAPAVGPTPVLLAENAAAHQSSAGALLLGGSGLPVASGPSAGTAAAGAGSTTAPGGSGSSSGNPPLPLPVGPTSSGPVLQLTTQINLAPAPVQASTGAGAGDGSQTGVGVTTPVTSPTVGQAPAPSSSKNSSSPSASVSATLPVAGTTSTSLP